jgi:hypothetical protein
MDNISNIEIGMEELRVNRNPEMEIVLKKGNKIKLLIAQTGLIGEFTPDDWSKDGKVSHVDLIEYEVEIPKDSIGTVCYAKRNVIHANFNVLFNETIEKAWVNISDFSIFVIVE